MTEREVAAILDEEEEDIIRCFNSGTKPFLRGGYEDELNLQGEVFMRTPNTSTQKMKSTMRPAEFSYTEDDEIDAVEFYSDTVGEKHIYSHESMNTRESENAPRSRMLRKKALRRSRFHKKASDESDDDGFGAHEIKEFDDYDDHDYDRKIFAGSPNRLDKVINKLASLDLTEVRKQIERQKQKLRKAIATAKQENGGIPRQRSRESSTSWSMASEVSYSNVTTLMFWKISNFFRDRTRRPNPIGLHQQDRDTPPKRKKHDPLRGFIKLRHSGDNDRFG
ncbi:hypothetical protein BC829DRAFT_413128 [Chytridium lagenaria]|nr:hypothetical protein BC829DRAFT_413128 [Chytridium lagenaria]